MNKYCVVKTYIDHLQPVNAVRWSPDGTCVASCSNDKKIKMYDIRSGRIIQHYDAHSAPITSLSYHPSGKYLVSSSLDSSVKIWDVFNSKILYTVHGHQGPVNSVDFSRDGDFICSGGADTTLMIWKNNLSGAGYPAKSKYQEDDGLSKAVTIPKKRVNSKTGLKCCKDKNNLKNNKSSSLNKVLKKEIKTNLRNKNPNSNLNSKNLNKIEQSNVNLYSSRMNNNIIIKSNEISLNNTNQSNKNITGYLPTEMKVTFEKLISQLDLVTKTVKIMDQRIESLEGIISTLYNRRKKGFVKKQPPHMGDYQYLLENSQNFMSNNSINNNEISQKINKPNNYDYYTADIYNSGENFKYSMNYNEDNKKNIFKTEIDLNQIKNSQEQIDNEKDMYKGQMEEQYEYNGEEQVVEGEEEEVNENDEHYEYNQGNNNEQEFDEGQCEEYEEGQVGEEYETHGEEYENEKKYVGEEYIEEDGNEEEQIEYDYKNEEDKSNKPE